MHRVRFMSCQDIDITLDEEVPAAAVSNSIHLESDDDCYKVYYNIIGNQREKLKMVFEQNFYYAILS